MAGVWAIDPYQVSRSSGNSFRSFYGGEVQGGFDEVEDRGQSVQHLVAAVVRECIERCPECGSQGGEGSCLHGQWSVGRCLTAPDAAAPAPRSPASSPYPA